MTYRTILVHVDDSAHLDTRVEVAAKIALHEQAQLCAVAATGVSTALHRPTVLDGNGNRIEPYRSEYYAALRERASAALAGFEALAEKFGIGAPERRLIDDDAASAVSSEGRYADLIVLGQVDAAGPALPMAVDFLEYVILNTECPVLVVPAAGRVFSIGERVLVGWNGSMAASRAVRNAMPFLRQAKSVQIAVVGGGARRGERGPADPGAERIIGYLARHGVNAGAIMRDDVRETGAEPGKALLGLASDLTSDLIVMGCVAHPRGRGMLLGGATRVALESSHVPLLMSH